MKNLLLFTSLLALCTFFLFGCGGNVVREPAQRFITNKLPTGILVHSFREKYDFYKGLYRLEFFLKNETGKKIEYPQIDGALFVDGKLEGPVTGGPGKHLDNLDSGLVSFSWILPTKVPDSVVFKFVEM